MVKPAWGMKRTCQGCGAHFYDLRKDPIICPKCATVYDPDAVSRTRRGRSSAAAPKPVPRVPVPELVEAPGEVAPELEEIAAEEGEAEGEEVTIEDTEDLPEDADEVSEVIENVDEEER